MPNSHLGTILLIILLAWINGCQSSQPNQPACPDKPSPSKDSVSKQEQARPTNSTPAIVSHTKNDHSATATTSKARNFSHLTSRQVVARQTSHGSNAALAPKNVSHINPTTSSSSNIKKQGGMKPAIAAVTNNYSDRKDHSSHVPAVEVSKQPLKYFWHGSYHYKPHPSNCRDTHWHPYLLAKPGAGGDPEKYALLDSKSEEIDVSNYPPEHQKTYKELVRTFCASCHSPARSLHRRFTAKQWQATLLKFKRRYSLDDRTVDRLYRFYLYNEEQMLKQDEEE